MLENLFKKVQSNYGIDKVKLIKTLLESGGAAQQKNILQGLGGKKDREESVKDHSIDQFSGGVDFLMDENILTNESREESDSQNMRTPGGIRNLNTNSINAINSAGFSNNQAMKKIKGSSKVVNGSNKTATAPGNVGSKTHQQSVQ